MSQSKRMGRLVTALSLAVMSAVGLRAAFRQADDRTLSAFVGVNVVSMESPTLLENSVVIVRDGAIADVGPVGTVTIPASARRIDARGKFLIPGLADMHVHFVGPEHYADIARLLVANGVTTVRCMWGSPELLRFARGSVSDPLVPRIVTTGPPTGGSPPAYAGIRIVTTAADARRAVAEDRATGYDAVKVYDRLSAPAYRALIQAAKDADLPVVGHVPQDVPLDEVLASGQKSIEHLQGYVPAVLADTTPRNVQPRGSSTNSTGVRIDMAKLRRVVASTKMHNVYNAPTLVVYSRLFEGARAGFPPAEELPFISPALRASWEALLEQWRPLLSGKLSDYEQVHQLRMQLVASLDAAEAPILLGTDSPNPYVAPGMSVHDELELLVEAGLTPYRALRTATVTPAAYFGRTATTGTIQPGKVADLVLLSANPLQNIRATRRLEGVMVRGRWLSEAELRSSVNAMVKRFEVNQ